MDHNSMGPFGALTMGAQREAPIPAASQHAVMDDLATRLLREVREQERVRDGLVAGAALGLGLVLFAAFGLS